MEKSFVKCEVKKNHLRVINKWFWAKYHKWFNANNFSDTGFLSLNIYEENIDESLMLNYPYKSMVKINERGETGEASGVMIGKDLIMTAGHCVKPSKNEHCYKDLIYMPAFPLKKEPYVAKAIYIHKDWYQNESYKRDIAIVQTSEKIKEIDTFLGVGIAFGKADYWTAYGYPTQNYERLLHWDKGFRIRCLNDDESEDIVSLSNIRLSEGASGGPQIPTNVNSFEEILKGKYGENDTPQYIGGINSHICDGAYIRNSPYFGEAIKTFIQDVFEDLGRTLP